jgi:hypothetical protein
MTNAIKTKSNTEGAEPKFTAAQIQENCPARLQQIGEEITRRVDQAQEHAKILDQVTELNKLIAEAREVKASTRAGVAKHRAAMGPVSVTVTENPEPEAAVESAPKKAGAVQTSNSAVEQTPKPTPRGSVAAGQEVMGRLAMLLMELNRRTEKRAPEHFFATAVPVEVLAHLGKFLTDLAALKKCEAAKPAPAGVVLGSDDISAKLSTECARIDVDLDARVAALMPKVAKP